MKRGLTIQKKCHIQSISQRRLPLYAIVAPTEREMRIMELKYAVGKFPCDPHDIYF